MMFIPGYWIKLCCLLCVSKTMYAITITDTVHQSCSNFALSELREVVSPLDVKLAVRISIDECKLKKQAFSLSKKHGQISIVGGDRVGVMYGILDLAEQLSSGKTLESIQPTEQTPLIKKRGVKINIPLDSRLPSYDDTGDAAQHNIAEMWSWVFWTEYIDSLAKNRYNLITLWSKHPFPGLIKMKDFPDVALDDVYVWAKDLKPEIHKDWRGYDLGDMKNHRLIKKITIEEKIQFWQRVMEYAHDRGIEFYFFSWNIYVTGAEKYGIEPRSEEAVSYMRECIREFVETYPRVTGIGVTAGENMGETVGERTNVEWLRDAYGKGIQDGIKGTAREFRFIFRRHHTNLESIDRDFSPHFDGNVETSFKYSFAHLYSTATPPRFDNEYAKDVEKYGYKCWMNLRNDDIFTFRWGDPDFVRTYWKKMMSYPVAGFYMGSDGYVWGREFTSKNKALSGRLEVNKHWYREMLWGRLAYNPDLSDEFFIQTLSSRFPEVNARALLECWSTASKIIPTVTNFHWKGGDSMWSVEGCFDIDGFHSVRDFINCYAFETSKIMNIPDYAPKVFGGVSDDRITPFEVADDLQQYAEQTLKQLAALTQNNKEYSEELKDTLADLEAMAFLGTYYSNKIRGATHLHLYEVCESQEDKQQYQQRAEACLQQALADWKQYAKNASGRYEIQLLARTRYLDWVGLIPEVEKDLSIVKKSTGKIPRVAKVFYRQHLREHPEIKERLKDALLSYGYEYQELRAWELHGHAVGKRILIGRAGDLSHEEFLNAGGVIPESYEQDGFCIVDYHGVEWVFGKDDPHIVQAIEQFLKLQN